jgi:hypothetical protein
MTMNIGLCVPSGLVFVIDFEEKHLENLTFSHELVHNLQISRTYAQYEPILNYLKFKRWNEDVWQNKYGEIIEAAFESLPILPYFSGKGLSLSFKSADISRQIEKVVNEFRGDYSSLFIHRALVQAVLSTNEPRKALETLSSEQVLEELYEIKKVKLRYPELLKKFIFLLEKKGFDVIYPETHSIVRNLYNLFLSLSNPIPLDLKRHIFTAMLKQAYPNILIAGIYNPFMDRSYVFVDARYIRYDPSLITDNCSINILFSELIRNVLIKEKFFHNLKEIDLVLSQLSLQIEHFLFELKKIINKDFIKCEKCRKLLDDIWHFEKQTLVSAGDINEICEGYGFWLINRAQEFGNTVKKLIKDNMHSDKVSPIFNRRSHTYKYFSQKTKLYFKKYPKTMKRLKYLKSSGKRPQSKIKRKYILEEIENSKVSLDEYPKIYERAKTSKKLRIALALKCPVRWVLEELFKNYPSKLVMVSLLRNPNTPITVKEEIQRRLMKPF